MDDDDDTNDAAHDDVLPLSCVVVVDAFVGPKAEPK